MTCVKKMHQLLTHSEIQLLMVVVMAGLLLALTPPDPDLKEIFFDRLLPNGNLFTKDVLLKVSARSRIDCSKKCVETKGCVMCTFLSSPQGPPGHCRLHSQLQNAADVKESKPGAKSVARRRLCDGDYELTCDRCLKAVNSQVSHTSAGQTCRGTQGQLVMTKTSTDVNCIIVFKNKKSLSRTWVDADDKNTSGVFLWKDGSGLPENSPLWEAGEPSKTEPGNTCVFLATTGLRDIPCTKSNALYNIICQKEVK